MNLRKFVLIAAVIMISVYDIGCSSGGGNGTTGWQATPVASLTTPGTTPSTKPTNTPSKTPGTTASTTPVFNDFKNYTPGIFEFRDFAYSVSGILTGANITSNSMIGAGIDQTVIQMAARSSTKAASVPTGSGTTNQLYLMALSKSGLKLGSLTINGTEQGHLYNGIRLIYLTGAKLENLKLIGVAPGNDLIPPGETFAINDYRGTKNSYTNVEIDGKGTGASAFGSNSSSGGTWTDCYAHHNPYSAGIALWQMTGTMTLTRFMSTNNRTGINLERVNGTVEIIQPTLKGNTAQDFFVGNDKGSTKINIYDPILETGKKIRIYYPPKEQGYPNLQNKADIKVFVNGVDVSGTMIQYL